MKSILVIGLGKFGTQLCKALAALGNDVMALDVNEDKIHDILPFVGQAKIGDSTKEAVLKEIGITDYDLVFVCVDSSFQVALETTFIAKELGAKYVICKSDHPQNEKFLKHNGADEVILPGKEIAEKMAKKYTANHVFDYIELNAEYGVYEVPVPEECIGKTIGECAFRTKYGVNILAIKQGIELNMAPGAAYTFKDEDHLMILGKTVEVKKFLKKI